MKKRLYFYFCHGTNAVRRSVAQPGSALGLGPRCRRFESSRSDQNLKGLAILSLTLFLCLRFDSCLYFPWMSRPYVFSFHLSIDNSGSGTGEELR